MENIKPKFRALMDFRAGFFLKTTRSQGRFEEIQNFISSPRNNEYGARPHKVAKRQISDLIKLSESRI